MLCPLCHSQGHQSLEHKQVPGEIFLCQNCDLIYKPQAQHLDWPAQKARYDLHQNNIESPGYKEFFEQLMIHLRRHLDPSIRQALDWGSGPGESPVLAEIMRKENLQVDLYDPIYQPKIQKPLYDLVVSTEVIEHFQNPEASLSEINARLRLNGIFAGLTNFHQGPEKFSAWWYANDPTHVVFYSEKTFHWIAKKWNFEILFLKNPVFIFKKL